MYWKIQFNQKKRTQGMEAQDFFLFLKIFGNKIQLFLTGCYSGCFSFVSKTEKKSKQGFFAVFAEKNCFIEQTLFDTITLIVL